jgi:N-acetylglucosamine-6-phosphate deacetylase
MNSLNKPTTLQIINHGVTISVTIDHSDVTIGEMFEAFKTAMVGITFSEEQMRDYMAQLVYEWQTWDEQK